MGMNPKDTIILFCNAWCSYLLIKYFKKKKKIDSKFIILFSLLFSTGTGIQFYFIGTLLPILSYILINLLLKKDFFKKNLFSFFFFIEFFLLFFFSMIFLLLFWPETHSNIFYSPINFIFENSSIRGWGLNLINGTLINIKIDKVPNHYFYIFFFYQSPEYILILIILFVLFFIRQKLKKKIFFLNYLKIFFFLVILIYPFLIVTFFKIKPYDSIRHFIWIIPYFLVIPSISLFYLIKKKIEYKFLLSFVLILKTYYIINFFLLTPYQYSYFNIFVGDNSSKHKKFEVDYWGVSLKELIKNIDYNYFRDKKLGTCGFNHNLAKDYFIKYHGTSPKFVADENAAYVIVVNRIHHNGLKTCDDHVSGEIFMKVKRNNQIFSYIKKNK